MNPPSVAPLSLTLRARAAAHPAQRFPVTARFTNTSGAPVRLLNLFEPLPVFFTTKLSPIGGGDVDIAGMGKLDPQQGSLRYEELAPGASFDVRLDLAPWIRGDVPPGPHRLSMQYHNAYGDDCFRGVVDSPPVTVNVGGQKP